MFFDSVHICLRFQVEVSGSVFGSLPWVRRSLARGFNVPSVSLAFRDKGKPLEKVGRKAKGPWVLCNLLHSSSQDRLVARNGTSHRSVIC